MTDAPAVLRQTPLHDVHIELGARMVPFAGFEMPVQYTSILEEHRTVRSAVGLFDLDRQAGLLTRLADGGLFERLARGWGSLGKRPQRRQVTADEDHLDSPCEGPMHDPAGGSGAGRPQRRHAGARPGGRAGRAEPRRGASCRGARD